MPPSLSGGVLSHIVYDYDPGPGSAHIDLTQILKAGSGSIGGLLSIRGYNDPNNGAAYGTAFLADGPLVEIASRVETIATELLQTVNQIYLGPDEDGGTPGHQASSTDLDGGQPAVYGLFDFAFAGAKDSDGFGDANDIGTHLGVNNYSSLLQLTTTDPRKVAAGLDLDPGTTGNITWAQGDNRNLMALSATQFQTMNFGVGNHALNATFGDAYNETVGTVGNFRVRADLNKSVATNNLDTARNRRDEISGVSLDEEFTSLIKFQKAYEASAKLIRIASELMDQLVNLI
ncbi:hypothetical protein OAO01_02510 [Oligoflexia bacterium]|nr:hypothetical protein [Oligoflexia bacterium]